MKTAEQTFRELLEQISNPEVSQAYPSAIEIDSIQFDGVIWMQEVRAALISYPKK